MVSVSDRIRFVGLFLLLFDFSDLAFMIPVSVFLLFLRVRDYT